MSDGFTKYFQWLLELAPSENRHILHLRTSDNAQNKIHHGLHGSRSRISAFGLSKDKGIEDKIYEALEVTGGSSDDGGCYSVRGP